jgi:hypothetical protein
VRLAGPQPLPSQRKVSSRGGIRVARQHIQVGLNLITQAAEWTRLGFLIKTSRGWYALPGPAGPGSTATGSAGP